MVAVLATAQSKDPFVGTWGSTSPRARTVPVPLRRARRPPTRWRGRVQVSVKNDPASGPVQQWSYTSNLDGKDVPITGNNPNADMVAVKRIDAHTLGHREQEGWQGHDDAEERGRGRRQDADGDDDGHRCARAEDQQRSGVREAVARVVFAREKRRAGAVNGFQSIAAVHRPRPINLVVAATSRSDPTHPPVASRARAASTSSPTTHPSSCGSICHGMPLRRTSRKSAPSWIQPLPAPSSSSNK